MPDLTHLYDLTPLKTWFEALSLDGRSMLVGAVRFSVLLLVGILSDCTDSNCFSFLLLSFYL